MTFQSVFDGSITTNDTDIQWRPYHSNCGCALHKLKGGSSHVCLQPRNVAFPKKKWQRDCSLATAGSTLASLSTTTSTHSSQSSPLPDYLSLSREQRRNG
ncbi:hypothetical protein SLE2022_032110 [Rubroshorea leprosula]